MYDYLNLPDSDFDIFFSRLCSYVLQKSIPPSGGQAAWPHIPAAERDPLIAAHTAWSTAYDETKGPHTSIATEAKNLAKAAAKKVIRSFVNRFLREEWQVVTPMDRDYLGIPNVDHTKTPHQIPSQKPDVEAKPLGKGKHHVTALNPDTESKKKPRLVTGVAFAHRLRRPEEAKIAADQMPSQYQRHVVREFQYGEESYGLVADYACAYEIDGGGRGTWSDIVSLIVS
jgi:hypothetical protein